MRIDERRPELPSATPPGQPRHWRVIAAGVSVVAVVALFALVLYGIVAGRGGTGPSPNGGPTNLPAGQWHLIDSLTYNTQPPISNGLAPAFSPVNPAIVYEASISPNAVRRSNDGGAHWKSLTLPSGYSQAENIEIFASPLDAHTAFLTIKGAASCAGSASTSSAVYMSPLAYRSGVTSCATTYRTTDEGKSWQVLHFPAQGTIANLMSSLFPYAGPPLLAQGTRLYALLNCGPTCNAGYPRLVASTDGGATWHLADGTVTQQRVCDFTAPPTGSTVYLVVTDGQCDSPANFAYHNNGNPLLASFSETTGPKLSLYRSDDAGATWSHASDFPEGSVLQGMAATTVDGKSLLYANFPAASWQIGNHTESANATQYANEFHVSDDGGRTWRAAPLKGVPTNARVIVSPISPRADGSLVVAFSTASGSDGNGAVIYNWRPGESSWRQFAPALAPQANVVALLRVAAATGGETFWAVMTGRSSLGEQAIAISLASYRP
jgi:hypothetical protein